MGSKPGKVDAYVKEMTVHKWLKDQMKERYAPNVMYIKAPAGIYSSRRGISDFIFCLNGVFVAIEVKSLKGKITRIQQDFLDEVIASGGIGVCLVGRDEGIFEILDNELAARRL